MTTIATTPAVAAPPAGILAAVDPAPPSSLSDEERVAIGVDLAIRWLSRRAALRYRARRRSCPICAPPGARR